MDAVFGASTRTMRLIVFGRIVRAWGKRSACRLDKYEFPRLVLTVDLVYSQTKMSTSQALLFPVQPEFCEYAGGPCDQSFSGLLPYDAFVIYASEPEFLARTIEEAVKGMKAQQPQLSIRTWRSLPIPGRIIFCEICKALRFAHVAVADVTTLNFNVLFEIGYSLGLGVPVIPIRDTTIARDTKELDELGMLDTLGYVHFQNSVELIQKLPGAIAQAAPIAQRAPLNHEQPLYFIKSHIQTEGIVKLMSALKKSGLKFRTFDPREISRLSLHDALKQVHSSLGVL